MHNAPKNYAEYHKEIEGSLQDQFLRKTLDSFAIAYRENRERIFKDVDEHALIHAIADMKDDACKHMEELYAQFKAQAEKRGVHVHRAATAEEANAIIARIARENSVKRVIKSKSMTAEEIELNPYLEKDGLIVDETDLGEWIIQLRKEPPSHMVMPAIHLSRYQVADEFTKATGVKQEGEDIQRLVKVSPAFSCAASSSPVIWASAAVTSPSPKTAPRLRSPTKATPAWLPRCPACTWFWPASTSWSPTSNP